MPFRGHRLPHLPNLVSRSGYQEERAQSARTSPRPCAGRRHISTHGLLHVRLDSTPICSLDHQLDRRLHSGHVELLDLSKCFRLLAFVVPELRSIALRVERNEPVSLCSCLCTVLEAYVSQIRRWSWC
jgi:hypothetical protein